MPLHESRTYVHSEKGKFSHIEKIFYKIKGSVPRRPLSGRVRNVVLHDFHLIRNSGVIFQLVVTKLVITNSRE